MSDLVFLVEKLENGSTDIASCLSSRPELSHDDQLQLVLADQKYRVRRGEPCDVGHYQRLLPWLVDDPQTQQQLIASEFALRLGTVPAAVLLEQFTSRYPTFRPSLAEQLRSLLNAWNDRPLSHEEFDALCDQFEEQTTAGQAPRIEDCLALAPAASRSVLVRELLRVEVYHRECGGTPPDWEDYHRRFPTDSEIIQQVQREHLAFQDAPPDGWFSTRLQPRQAPPKDLTGSFISDRTVGDLRNGRYRFARKLGQGAYGAVYLAQDMDLKRQVAVKVPKREALEKLIDIDSYLKEAQNVAALDHPHIVTVYDVGRTLDGSIYVVSKFIDGCSLADWIKKQTLDFRTIAKMLTQIAEALHHAHQRRLIHRDIKPANILIDESTGTPYVADFGLAIREEDYLQDGRVAGTPAYMSPEQVRGEGHRLDGRSDLFSLGVVMYQMLTGRMPFPGLTYHEIAHEITSVEPASPRTHKSDIPAELERICLKLLRKRASERYANGRELAEDLRAWLSPTGSQVLAASTQRITPRGLRSFTAEDAGFFLDLLPGPRNREGLPESIVFWKERIEQRDSDQTFTVGLLYGPSGCGKSSLVKAGLIPSLSPEVIAIYIEATPEETESRLLRQLRKRIPELPNDLGLVDALKQLRRSEFKKVVFIIDQFEQWLYANSNAADAELTNALRQCDGANVQAIVMVREDFWISVSRFLRELDIPVVERDNSAMVDLFDLDHAKTVFTSFGRAYGKLSENRSEWTEDQKAFIDQSIEGLSEKEKVISVRISLLAEMLKNKKWHPETLVATGGISGVGVRFLEETFGDRHAPIQYRQHQEAVRGFLEALLPPLGSDIKGTRRATKVLQASCGYEAKPLEYKELLKLLTHDLKLITPVDDEGASHSFQLTHDYLVPSLREWLTQKQRETRKGRAEIKLADRAAAWSVHKESKQLPTLLEWFQIRRLTDPARWKAHEKFAMQKATRHHARRIALATATMLLIVYGGWFAWRETARIQEATQIAGLVETLTNAEPAKIPDIVKQINANPQVADQYLAPILIAEGKTADIQRAQLHARLARVARDPSHIEQLVEEMLTGKVNYVLPIRQLLRPSAGKITGTLRTLLNDDKGDPQRRFRAALALAEYGASSDQELWTEPILQILVQQLVSFNAEYQPILREALRPIHDKLLIDLEQIFCDSTASEAQRLSAANALADYAGNDRERMTKLLTEATPEQHGVIYPLVSAVPSPETISQLSQVAATPPPEELGSVARIAYGQRRANAAVTMLKLGEKEKVFPVFDWTDDPEAMTQFIFRCKPRGISVDNLLDLLEITTRSVSEGSDAAASGPTSSTSLAHASGWDRARYAIMLAIGEYAPTDISPARREALIKQLADWYANDPSSGVHGASGWLLRHLGENEIATRIDQTPVPYSPDREWFTLAITVRPTLKRKPKPKKHEESGAYEANAEESGPTHTEPKEPDACQSYPLTKIFYYTFIVFPRGEYSLGSVVDEVDRNEQPATREVRHQVTLTRSFAMLDREILNDEMHSFNPLNYAVPSSDEKSASTPCGGVDWYDSVAFCCWLGREMGLRESEQCYEDPDSLDDKRHTREPSPEANGVPMDWPLNVTGRGFRLPTEAEWEIASRSKTRTSYGFGSDVSLLQHFGWFRENSGKRAHLGREKRPSVRGLFDLHGNLFEWTHDSYSDFQSESQIDPISVKLGLGRIDRGGGWGSGAASCRSANRGDDAPTRRIPVRGFRLALVPSGPGGSGVAGSVPAEPVSGTGEGNEAEGDRRREE